MCDICLDLLLLLSFFFPSFFLPCLLIMNLTFYLSNQDVESDKIKNPTNYDSVLQHYNAAQAVRSYRTIVNLKCSLNNQYII